MIVIEKLTTNDVQELKKIKVAPENIKFSGTVNDFLNDTDANVHHHVMKQDGTLVGFFKLDIAYQHTCDFCPSDAIGLRAFVIGDKYQGKGYGTETVKALFPYLQANYSRYGAIYLTVNCKNPAAIACYQKGGFVQTGDLYLGGSAGPQFIMKGDI